MSDLENEVEVEALTADDFKSPPQGRLEDHLVQAAPALAVQPRSAPEAREAEEEAPVTRLAEKPAADPLERAQISNSLVNTLLTRFNRLPNAALTDLVLQGDDDASIVVSVRKRDYKDNMWALGLLEQWVEAGKNLDILTSDIPRRTALEHLASVRCILKIDGEWIWEVTGHTSWLKKNNPAFDHDVKDVPLIILSQVHELIFELLQTLHPTLLFQLDSAINDAEVPDDDDETPPDPSSAT